MSWKRFSHQPALQHFPLIPGGFFSLNSRNTFGNPSRVSAAALVFLKETVFLAKTSILEVMDELLECFLSWTAFGMIVKQNVRGTWGYKGNVIGCFYWELFTSLWLVLRGTFSNCENRSQPLSCSSWGFCLQWDNRRLCFGTKLGIGILEGCLNSHR